MIWITRAALVAAMSLVLAGCGSGASSGGSTPPRDATLMSLRLEPNNTPTRAHPDGKVVVALSGMRQFNAIGTYQDASTGATSERQVQAAWSSSDTAVLAVDSTGLASGLAPGKATLTATVGSSTATADVTVSTPTLVSIGLSDQSIQLQVANTKTISAYGLYDDDVSRPIVAAWSINNSATATLEPTSGSSTTIQPRKVGTAIITANVSAPQGTLTASAALNVSETTGRYLTSISLSPGDVVLAAGEVVTLKATGLYSDNTSNELDVDWSVSNPNAQVTPLGGKSTALKGISVGDAVVTASAQGSTATVTAQIKVKVVAASTAVYLKQLLITPENASLPAGASRPFSVSGLYSDGSVAPVASGVTWASSNTSVLQLANAGATTVTATANTPGSSVLTVTAASNGTPLTRSATVTVTEPSALVSVSISPQSPADITVGQQRTFSVNGVYSDGSSGPVVAPITWTVTPADVASLDRTDTQLVGVTGLKSGAATVGVNVAAPSGGTYSDSTTLQVKPQPKLTAIKINPNPIPELVKGSDTVVSALGSYDDGSTGEISTVLNWKSSDPSVVSAPATGNPVRLTAVNTGSAVITASTVNAQGLTVAATASVSVAVPPSQVVSLSLQPSVNFPLRIPLGASLTFKAIAKFGDGHSEALTSGVTWASSGDSVTVTVNDDASAVAKGAALSGLPVTLTASITRPEGTFTASQQLITGPADVVSLRVDPHRYAMFELSTLTFRALAVYTDSPEERLVTDRPVTWTYINGPINFSTDQAPTKDIYGESPGHGEFYIKVRNSDNTDVFANQTVDVVPDELVSVLRYQPAPGYTTTIPRGFNIPFQVIGQFRSGAERPIAPDAIDFTPISTAEQPAVALTDGSVLAKNQGTGKVIADLKSTTASLSSSRHAEVAITVTDPICISAFRAPTDIVQQIKEGLCPFCSITNINNAIDSDATSSAVMRVPSGSVAAKLTLEAKSPELKPGDDYFGFIIERPKGSLSASDMRKHMYLTALRSGAVVATSDEIVNPIKVKFLGQAGPADVAVVSAYVAVPFDAIRLTLDSGSSVTSPVSVRDACARATSF